MILDMKILATANINGNNIACTGQIEFKRLNSKQVYVSWSISDQEKLIASVSDSYYLNDIGNTEDHVKLLPKVIQKISDYKINRKKIFSELKVLEN
jgi:hypothetical protein